MSPFVTVILQRAYELALKRGLHHEYMKTSQFPLPQVTLAFDHPVSNDDFENMPINVELSDLYLDRGFTDPVELGKILSRPGMRPTIYLGEWSSSDWSALRGKEVNFIFHLKRFVAPEKPFTFNKDFIEMHFEGKTWEKDGGPIDLRNILGLNYIDLHFSDAQTLKGNLHAPNGKKVKISGPSKRMKLPADQLVLQDTNSSLELKYVDIDETPGSVFNWVEWVYLGPLSTLPDPEKLRRMFPLSLGFSFAPEMTLKELPVFLKTAAALVSLHLDCTSTKWSKEEMEELMRSRDEKLYVSMSQNFPEHDLSTLSSKNGWQFYSERY